MWFKHQSTKTTLKSFSGKNKKEQQLINKWKKTNLSDIQCSNHLFPFSFNSPVLQVNLNQNICK